MPLKLTTYYRGKDIPDLPGNNTFHSKELFQIYESTPGYTPLLIVATEKGRPVARLLAAIRKTKKWLPSSLVKQCVVYGAGEFLNNSLPASKEKEEEIFGEMLEHLTQEASRTCILIEFRNLDNSMFGYRFFPGQLAACPQFSAQYTESRRSFQPVSYPANQKGTQKRSESRRSSYGGRN